jgi:alcohol dehydrogenase class IV
MHTSFSFSGIPKFKFGAKKINLLPDLAKEFGSSLLLITGGSSLKKSGILDNLLRDLKKSGVKTFTDSVSSEPSPDVIDTIVRKHKTDNISIVCAIGGGSAIDTGKAVAAMLTESGSVKDFLEGVGSKTPSGNTLPFIAVPTTSGTGSEATKNAVISEIGVNGFKKSLRHDNYIPTIAILDPELTISCPANITASSGMDALSQLMESYVSTGATPLTDVLALDGIKRVFKSLIPVSTEQHDNIELREEMSYAAFLSGVTLAHAGLGTVHGLASPLGAAVTAPHGVICGKLLPPWCRATIELLRRSNDSESVSYLNKFADIGRILMPKENNSKILLDNLIKTLNTLDNKLSLPRLSTYGLTKDLLPSIASNGGNKNNPISLSKETRIKTLNEVL